MAAKRQKRDLTLERQLSVRVQVEIWETLMATAARDQRTAGEIVRRILADWHNGSARSQHEAAA
jgi:hypothetical protein